MATTMSTSPRSRASWRSGHPPHMPPHPPQVRPNSPWRWQRTQPSPPLSLGTHRWAWRRRPVWLAPRQLALSGATHALCAATTLSAPWPGWSRSPSARTSWSGSSSTSTSGKRVTTTRLCEAYAGIPLLHHGRLPGLHTRGRPAAHGRQGASPRRGQPCTEGPCPVTGRSRGGSVAGVSAALQGRPG